MTGVVFIKVLEKNGDAGDDFDPNVHEDMFKYLDQGGGAVWGMFGQVRFPRVIFHLKFLNSVFHFFVLRGQLL